MRNKRLKLGFGLLLLMIIIGNFYIVKGAEALPKDYSCTLTTCGWDENYWNTIVTEFNKIYPNIKFDYTPVANGDYLQKLQTTLAAGTRLQLRSVLSFQFYLTGQVAL